MLAAVELPDEAVADLLDTWPVARLATLGPDLHPHQVPIVFARSAEALWSPVDGKPKRGGEPARIRNARERPAVSLLLDDYAADWERLWWLRVDGEARVVRPRDPEADAEVSAALAALRAKYPQYGRVAILADPPTLLCIRVVAQRSWCAGASAVPAR